MHKFVFVFACFLIAGILASFLNKLAYYTGTYTTGIAQAGSDDDLTKSERSDLFHHSRQFRKSSTQEALDSWVTECVECPEYYELLTDRSLRLDANDQPHIIYGGDQLYHAWYDGSMWQYEIADNTPGVGTSAAMALDANGFAHASYLSHYNTKLSYAYQDASGWHAQSVDDASWAYTSLAIDTNGFAHIGYIGNYPNSIKYAHQDAGGWYTETVDSLYSDILISLALDTDNFPHLVYNDLNIGELRYAYKDISGWHIQFIDNGLYPSLSLDVSGYAHISYSQQYPANVLKYAYQDADGWHYEIVDAPGVFGYSTSIGLDQNGYPHISYWADPQIGLKYAYKDSTGWHTQVVADIEEMGWHTSLAVDAAGFPHISYMDHKQSDVQYAYPDSSGWHYKLIETGAGYVGLYNSLKLGENDYPRIGYSDNRNDQLNFAFKDSDGWYTETVDGSTEGTDVSLALDEAGLPHMSYYDGINDDLKYSYKDAEGWHSQVVDNEGGRYASLQLDLNQYPHISYYANGLKYAYQDANGWYLHVIDDADQSATSLALDDDGFPHISYYGLFNQLKYAYQDATGWYVEIVDVGVGVGQNSSLALDANNNPHISYYDFVNGDLKYAFYDASGWHIQNLASAGDAGKHSSLVIDTAGYPHITYSVYDDILGYTYNYAYQDINGWHFQVINIGGYVGSLDLDSLNAPHVSYYDSLMKDLNYAYLDLTPVSPSLVTLDGPEFGVVQNSYVFTAEVSPISTTTPIQYVWLATDRPPYTHTSGVLDTTVFTWDFPGTKTITVTASNPLGIVTDTHLVTLTDIPIYGLSAINDGPTELGLTTALTATISQGSNVIFQWAFGDGESGSGSVVSHTYPSIGIYTSTVSATNSINTLVTTTLITVLDVPISGLAVSNDSPTELGDQTALTATVLQGSNVIFFWAFGDGTYGSGSSVMHTYLETGIFTAVVTATNTSNSTSTNTQVTVDIPLLNLTANNNSPTELGNPTTLTATISQGSNVAYIWNFGDETTDSGDVVTHTYPSVGDFTAIVTATNSVSTQVVTTTITILDVPIAGLTAFNDSPTPFGETTHFTATTISGSNVTFTWDFGDETTGSGAITSHAYLTPGVYTATVTAQNSAGAVTANTLVTVIAPPSPYHLTHFPLVQRNPVR